MNLVRSRFDISWQPTSPAAPFWRRSLCVIPLPWLFNGRDHVCLLANVTGLAPSLQTNSTKENEPRRHYPPCIPENPFSPIFSALLVKYPYVLGVWVSLLIEPADWKTTDYQPKSKQECFFLSRLNFGSCFHPNPFIPGLCSATRGLLQ